MTSRRSFLGAGVVAGALLSSRAGAQEAKPAGSEHCTTKKTPDGDVRLCIWLKRPANISKGAILCGHGSSVQSLPVFDLHSPGKPEYSDMDWVSRPCYDHL